jgi:dTDP-4-amino-4,6-dideoxygalactose transaminase
MLMNIPFSKVPLAGNEFNYISEVLKSGWLTTSAKAHEFEKRFAEYVGAKYACAVNSCTSALHLAVEAIGIQPGNKVIVPALTFTASAEIIRYIGADPVFTDVEYETGLISPEILEQTISKHPEAKALILVHYAGQPARMTTDDKKGVLDICRRNNIKLIEDAAHAFPAKYGDKHIGTFGDATCFSFYANKTITTGEGGMLVTNDESIYKRVKVMRLHGINRDIWNRFTDNKASWEYDVIAPGFKYNMPDINAAIGLAQLEKAEYFRSQRQRCAEMYMHELKGLTIIDLPTCYGPFENHSWHIFSVIIKPDAPVPRNDFIKLMAQAGIGTSVHYKPLHRMTYYKERYNLKPKDFPNTEKIWTGTVSLPIYPELSDEQIKYICKIIKDILIKK